MYVGNLVRIFLAATQLADTSYDRDKLRQRLHQVVDKIIDSRYPDD